MGGTELKTDSFHRWMMYSKDAYGRGRVFLTTEHPSFRESLMTSYGMSYEAATDYIERYNASVDRINASLAQSASRAMSALADAASDLVETATPLGDAQPFEYAEGALSGDSMDLAGNLTPNMGTAGIWFRNPGSGQMRMYGQGGFPVVDFDFDHDHG